MLCTGSAWIAPEVAYLGLKKQRGLGYDNMKNLSNPLEPNL